ncbi:hypothetical protein AWB91_13980 [Mycobacterium paraense]|uniref:Uncharacterized protein n=1 Tax=Mycobacterium paraense TaxID=767916 RepID=A0A1X2AK85_9MYCO|nr:hypothetical protein AWB91_13980 [Mycobacterium paraense]ORW39621.1 hypothetical protein AWB88_17765 [Mycobacterium paraense]ORW47269.1 hypothetical protein AWB89_08990 [Mycobacterium paraense]ORW51770.1 hypothetical protein AWB90_04470 [Mycobacterium paraense]
MGGTLPRRRRAGRAADLNSARANRLAPNAGHATIAVVNRLSEDWWATLLAGVIVALAVAGALPRIPW